MIKYEAGGFNAVWNVFKLTGSVFPKALFVSLPSSVLSATVVTLVHSSDIALFNSFQNDDAVMTNNAFWGGFSSIVGFLVVFRTSQAYNRFWEGCGAMHKMGAEWFDGCSAVMSFVRHSTTDEEKILNFQNILVRLFSMLHAAAMGEIEETGDGDSKEVSMAHTLDLIDPESIDECTLRAIHECNNKVELIFQWIQQLIVANISTGVLSIPPPILSRCFQEIATGMVHFHEALKVSVVPFPFPYAQSCDTLLLIHWVLVPFVVATWITKPWWAFTFSFIQVFTLWTLNFIAVELENPFGTDPNDMDGFAMQQIFNNSLRLLLQPQAKELPTLLLNGRTQKDLVEDIENSSNFASVWQAMQQDGASPRRFTISKARRIVQGVDFAPIQSIRLSVADEGIRPKVTRQQTGVRPSVETEVSDPPSGEDCNVQDPSQFKANIQVDLDGSEPYDEDVDAGVQPPWPAIVGAFSRVAEGQEDTDERVLPQREGTVERDCTVEQQVQDRVSEVLWQMDGWIEETIVDDPLLQSVST